ncbi:hypothetical protein EDB85DRAFT_2064468 [Lactarius pseudohatsudake]|nr:hypothetical protein EDB85DRAFT_2064468 [Lactarius pseudohatsudake]
MSLQGLCDSEIREPTGISVRSLKRFQQTHCEMGGVPSPPPIDNGRPCTLTAIQVKFLRDSVDCQPDVSLVELQVELQEACGTEVSLSTVLHSLQREGYTMKTYPSRSVQTGITIVQYYSKQLYYLSPLRRRCVTAPRRRRIPNRRRRRPSPSRPSRRPSSSSSPVIAVVVVRCCDASSSSPLS